MLKEQTMYVKHNVLIRVNFIFIDEVAYFVTYIVLKRRPSMS